MIGNYDLVIYINTQANYRRLLEAWALICLIINCSAKSG